MSQGDRREHRGAGPELDPTRPLRADDDLDLKKLEALVGAPVSVTRFPRGHSNLTYLVKTGDRELVLRRPPPGAKAIKAGHDMEREYRLLSKLHPLYAKAPAPVLHADGYFLMERVRGVILRGEPPAGFDLSPPVMRKVSEAVVENLVELHAVDSSKLEIGHPEGYVERQVKGWNERYEKAKTHDIADMESAARWLAERIPPSRGASVIHNDYKYDNIVLDEGDLSKVKAVLDWEMATVGDPLADLGTMLAYWFEPSDPDEVRQLGLGLTALPGNLRRDEVVALYGARSGRDISEILFHYVAAVFKVGVIAQQLHFRWKQGYTKDERFAGLDAAVRALGALAVRAIERQRIAP